MYKNAMFITSVLIACKKKLVIDLIQKIENNVCLNLSSQTNPIKLFSSFTHVIGKMRGIVQLPILN